MKKTLSLILVLLLVFACLSMMGASCKDKGNNNNQNSNQGSTDDHGNGENNGGNDDQGGTTPPTIVPGETVESDVECVNDDWKASQEMVIISVNDCSDNNVMQAGGRAYISGRNDYTTESAVATNAILKKVIQRNSDAAAYANVSLAYSYSSGGWGNATTMIGENISSGVSGMPDVYYDSVYDMVASSIKGHFQNILGNTYFKGQGQEAADGYNRDYMDILTFSTKAEYLIASDYSIDISRNFYLLPVNMNILTEKASLVVEDRTGDSVIDVSDFFDVIDDEEWTWDFIAQLCEAVKVEATGGGYIYNDGICGMVIDTAGGLAASGICYASELQIIERYIDDETCEYVYRYETEGAALSSVAIPLANSVKLTDGFVKNSSSDGYASSTDAIAHAFSENHILIGNVILLGAIEQQVYRDMWDEENDRLGFVCAPMPLYHNGTAGEWTYHTVVHNTAKVFGIATTCSKLDRAIAFLDYASTHSTDILEDFYKWTILYDAANGDEHNVEYLTNMKANMEYNLDKTVDDALGVFGSAYGSGTNMKSKRWHIILRDGADGAEDDGFGIGAGIVSIYQGLYEIKEIGVTQIQNAFLGVQAQ